MARGEPLQPDRVDSSLRTAEAVARLAILHDQLQGVDAGLAEQVSRAWMREPDGRTALVFDFKVTARGGPSIARVVLLRTAPRVPPVLFGIHLLRLSESRPPGDAA